MNIFDSNFKSASELSNKQTTKKNVFDDTFSSATTTPFDATKTGIFVNTIKGLPQASRDVVKNFSVSALQGILRSGATVGQKVISRDINASFTPTGTGVPLYGTDKPTNFSTIGKEARFASPESPSVPVIDPIVGGVIATLDLLTGGESKVARKSILESIQTIARSSDESVIKSLLEKITKLPKEAIPNLSKELVDIKTPEEVSLKVSDTVRQYIREGEIVGGKLPGEVKVPDTANITPTVTPEVFKNEGNLTTKILKDLEGKSTVSKQYILDATNRGELKQVERDITRQVLDTMEGDTINVKEFADKVKSELLPLKISTKGGGTKRLMSPDESVTDAYGVYKTSPRYESISLPSEVRGSVKDYSENVYQSPVKTSAGGTHFLHEEYPNYFGHTRIEDMADNKTRRVIEVQSDLYQKGNLEREGSQANEILKERSMKEAQLKELGAELTDMEQYGDPNNFPNYKTFSDQYEQLKSELDTEVSKFIGKEAKNRASELSKLQQYSNPTAHFRMVREEIKKAAQDGKTKLQFPTGETALRIEGLVDTEMWNRGSKKASMGVGIQKLEDKHIRMGEIVNDGNTDWIVSNKLGEGKFKALPKDAVVSDLKKSFPNISEKEINDFIILCL